MKNINKTCELMASGMTISEALKGVYKTRKIMIPYIEKHCNVSTMDLNLSARATNSLMRSKLDTANKIIEFLCDNKWNEIKNFGRVSAEETFERILDLLWDRLDVKEKAEFLLRVDAANETIE
jgi:DNA-directed RNA polymerase alpha subunit